MRPPFRTCLVALSVIAGASFAAAQEAEFPQGQWLATEVAGTAVGDGVTISLELAEDGMRVSGSSGCNRYTGPVTISGSIISFGAIAGTRMLCTPEMMDEETRYLDALGKVESWQLGEDHLDLLGKDETTLVSLRKNETSAATITIEVPGAVQVNTEKSTYSCDGFSVTAEYFNAGPVSLATLQIEKEFIVAANVLAASGAKYAGERFIWWTKGEEADLYDLTNGEDAPPVHCSSAAP